MNCVAQMHPLPIDVVAEMACRTDNFSKLRWILFPRFFTGTPQCPLRDQPAVLVCGTGGYDEPGVCVVVFGRYSSQGERTQLLPFNPRRFRAPNERIAAGGRFACLHAQRGSEVFFSSRGRVAAAPIEWRGRGARRGDRENSWEQVHSCLQGLRASFFDRFLGRAVNNAYTPRRRLGPRSLCSSPRLALRTAAACEVRASRPRLFIAVGHTR